jgi:hypothetical protein
VTHLSASIVIFYIFRQTFLEPELYIKKDTKEKPEAPPEIIRPKARIGKNQANLNQASKTALLYLLRPDYDYKPHIVM